MEFVRSYDSTNFGLPQNRGGSAPALSVSGPVRVEENAVGFRFSLALSAVSSFVRV
jgi:hypothetical protein